MATDLVSTFAGWQLPAGDTGLAQFTFVGITDGQLVTATAGDFAVVLYDAPSIAGSTYDSDTGLYSGGYEVGTNYSFVAADFPKVIFGGTVSPGDLIATNDTGKAVAAGSGDVILGVAMEAHVSGDLGVIKYTAAAIHA